MRSEGACFYKESAIYKSSSGLKGVNLIDNDKIEKYVEEIKDSLKKIQQKIGRMEKEQFQMRMMLEDLEFLIRKK